MNVGWYLVYIFAIIINSIMCSIHGFTIGTVQYWVWMGLLIMSFVAGSEYRNKEDD